ncbi:MAG TPA: SE1832 family protein [Pseudogracilibacillus sp.]|nr:SE1832 family protein [Pseudogracilibacillus sp.]
MDKKQLEQKLLELKSDYVRIQGDLDKLEVVGGRIHSAQEQLERLEKEIADINERLESFDA